MHIRHITFETPDPLGDGLREEIAAEQAEPEAIVLDEQPTGEELQDYLQNIITQSESDQDFDTTAFSED